MGGACSTHGEKRNASKILVETPERKRPFERRRKSLGDNIRMDLREMECEVMDCKRLALGRDQ
jgi:hypothetical protein